MIDSGPAEYMVDSTSEQLLAEIARKHRLPRLHVWAAALAVLLVACLAAAGRPVAVTLSGLAAGAVVAALRQVDRRRKTVELEYDLDAAYARRYEALLAAFGGMTGSAAVWSVGSETAATDRKYHAGAGAVVGRVRVTPARGLPA